MHQTTVRFGPDLWETLETECRRLGISAAQFIREAALARLAYNAGSRGDPELETAFVSAGIVSERPAQDPYGSGMARAVARDSVSDSTALSASNTLVLARARAIRAQSRQLRHKRKEPVT